MERNTTALETLHVDNIASLKHRGFREVDLKDVSFEQVAKAAGVHLKIEGRLVKVKDREGWQVFTDDYYYTGTRFLFGELETRTGVIS